MILVFSAAESASPTDLQVLFCSNSFVLCSLHSDCYRVAKVALAIKTSIKHFSNWKSRFTEFLKTPSFD